MLTKKVKDSFSTQLQIIMHEHINGYGRLFGGKLMEWIDVVAAVVARRHSGCEVTTACVDNLRFTKGAHLNSTLIIEGRITYVGNTSMEVRVDSYTEALSGVRKQINTAYLVMVAIDEADQPVVVPRLELCTEEEKREYENGKLRVQKRKAQRDLGLYQ